MKPTLTDIMFFIGISLVFISLFALNGCATPYKQPDRERISIMGAHPVIIEQDYSNQDGNVVYSTKIEIKQAVKWAPFEYFP